MGVWDKLDDPMSFRTRGGSPVSELGILEVVSGTWAVLGNAQHVHGICMVYGCMWKYLDIWKEKT